MTVKDTGYMGMNPGAVGAIEDSGGWQLLKLCNELEIVKHLVPNRRDGNPVPERYLGQYMHNQVAPDHLLAGILKYFDIVLFFLC